jgi:hypothetical protein
MGVLIYFLLGVVTTIFYGGIIPLVKPKLLPFRIKNQIPTHFMVLKIWAGLLVACVVIVIILTAIHGNFGQKEATPLQSFSALLGFLGSIVWWVLSYKKLDHLEKEKIDQHHAEQLVILKNMTFTDQIDQQMKNRKESKASIDVEIPQTPPPFPVPSTPPKSQKTTVNHSPFQTNQSDFDDDFEDFCDSDFTDYEAQVEIDYKDYYGKASSREIAVIDVYKKGDAWFVDGYCFSAYAERTFKLERIEFLKVLKTGNFVFSQQDILKALKKFV